MAASLAIGAGGGWIASLLGSPLPWLIGATAANAVWVLAFPGRLNPVWAPPMFRHVFVAIIGVMIGGLFTADLMSTLPGWWPSVVTLLVYSVITQLIVYVLYRRIGGLDRPTAFFSASPGGLIENIVLGEAAGANTPVLSVLQFLRIVIVVISVPFGFLLWTGSAVGSAAGATFGEGGAPLGDYALMIIAGAVGLFGGLKAGIPAGQIVGPILMSGLLHITGIVETQPPPIVATVAQVVIGASLGARFAGADPRALSRAAPLALLGVGVMLGLAVVFAVALSAISGRDPALYVMSFSPAGVIEMSLIALTLGANPVFVTAHHIIRILVTVLMTPQIYYRLLAQRDR